MVIMMASLSLRFGDPTFARIDPFVEAIGSTFEVLTVSEFQQALEKFGFQLSPEDRDGTLVGEAWLQRD